MDWRELVTIDVGRQGGQPCLRGTRISVYVVLYNLAAGETEATILAEYPSPTPLQARRRPEIRVYLPIRIESGPARESCLTPAMTIRSIHSTRPSSDTRIRMRQKSAPPTADQFAPDTKCNVTVAPLTSRETRGASSRYS